MKYKGFIIKPVYHACLKLDKRTGNYIERKPTKQDLAYYEILDPMEDNKRWIAENTIQECKATINEYLAKVNMKDNSKKSWDKLK